MPKPPFCTVAHGGFLGSPMRERFAVENRVIRALEHQFSDRTLCAKPCERSATVQGGAVWDGCASIVGGLECGGG